MKYLTPKGLTRWSDSTVRRILKNEKYKGDVLQGKTYTTDPITHKRVINMGEENQYYIKEHHTAIIEPELFDKVQQILEKRAGSRSKGKRRGNYSRKYPFSSRIYCGFCGTVLTRRNWNSKTKNETPVWHCMNFVKRGKQECPKCKAMREKVIENCFVDAYKILCSNKGDIVNKFITRINNIITENSSSKLIENIETEKGKLKSKMNKLIDLSLENAVDRETFLERKEKIQNQIEQLNLKQEKLVLDERNKTNRKLSLNKLKRYLENGKIITEFDKDAFEILVKQVIIGGYDEKDKADPKQVTFVLKNESKVNYEDYLQTSNDISQKNLQMSNHTGGSTLSNGSSFTTGTSDKYSTAYDGTDVNTNYKYGDATYETSGWHSDFAGFVYSLNPFFGRGSSYGDGDNAGTFSFYWSNGISNNIYSFRLALVV